MEGTVDELFDPAEMILELQTINHEKALAVINNSSWKNFLQKQQSETFFFKMNKKDIPAFNIFLVNNDVEVLSFQSRHSLEDYFLSLTSANQHVETFTN